jgi:hypothetical protein
VKHPHPQHWGLYRWDGGVWHVWEPGQNEGRLLCGLMVHTGMVTTGIETRLMLLDPPPESVAGTAVCKACLHHLRTGPTVPERMAAAGYPEPFLHEVAGELYEAKTAYFREGWTNAAPEPARPQSGPADVEPRPKPDDGRIHG